MNLWAIGLSLTTTNYKCIRLWDIYVPKDLSDHCPRDIVRQWHDLYPFFEQKCLDNRGLLQGKTFAQGNLPGKQISRKDGFETVFEAYRGIIKLPKCL